MNRISYIKKRDWNISYSIILDILTDNQVTLEHRVLEAGIDFFSKKYEDDKGDEEEMHKSISGLKSGHRFSNKMSFLLIT